MFGGVGADVLGVEHNYRLLVGWEEWYGPPWRGTQRSFGRRAQCKGRQQALWVKPGAMCVHLFLVRLKSIYISVCLKTKRI